MKISNLRLPPPRNAAEHGAQSLNSRNGSAAADRAAETQGDNSQSEQGAENSTSANGISARNAADPAAPNTGNTGAKENVTSPTFGEINGAGDLSMRLKPIEADALAAHPGEGSTVLWADCTKYTNETHVTGYPYIQSSVEFTNAKHGCRGGKNIVSGRLYYAEALSFDATSTDAARLNGYKVYLQWQDSDGAVSPVYWANTHNVPGASQGGDGVYAFYLPTWTDSRGLKHEPRFSGLLGNIKYKLWIAPNQKGPGGGDLVAVRQGPGNGVGFKNGGRDGYFGSFFLEGSNLQRTSVWAWEKPQDYITASEWKIDGKNHVKENGLKDARLRGTNLVNEPILSGSVWWETKEPDLAINMPNSTNEYTAGGSDIWIVSSVLTPEGLTAARCGPRWEVGVDGKAGQWGTKPAYNTALKECEQPAKAPNWDPRARGNQTIAVAFQKELLTANPQFIAQTVASYVHPAPDNNKSVGYYMARFDRDRVTSIPGPGAGINVGDGVYQYAVRFETETTPDHQIARDADDAPKLKRDAQGRPIVKEIVQEISATSAPFYGPQTLWATSAWQFTTAARPIDDMNHALYANRWSAIDITNFDASAAKAKPGDIAEIDVNHIWAPGQTVWIRWRDQDGNIVMSPVEEEKPKVLNPGCWYRGANDEDPTDGKSAATLSEPNGGKDGCWLQVPRDLSGEKLYTVELVAFGDVLDADSFVAVGGGRPDYKLIPSAIADPKRPEDPDDKHDKPGVGARLKNVPYWVDNNGKPIELFVDKTGKKLHPHGHFGLQWFGVAASKLRKDGEWIGYNWAGGGDAKITICGEEASYARYNESYSFECKPSEKYAYGEVTFTPDLNRHGTGLYEIPMRWYPTDESGNSLPLESARNTYGDIVKGKDSRDKPYIEMFAPFWVENPDLSYAVDYDPQYGTVQAHPLQRVTLDVQWNETESKKGDKRFPGDRVKKCKLPAKGTLPSEIAFPEEMRDWVILNPGTTDKSGKIRSVNWKNNTNNACQLTVKVPPSAKNGDEIKIPVQFIYENQGLKAETMDIAIATVKVWTPQVRGKVVYDQNGNAKIGQNESTDVGLPGVQVVLQAEVPYTDVFGKATKNGQKLVEKILRVGTTNAKGEFAIESVVAGDCLVNNFGTDCKKADYQISLNPLSFSESGKAPCADDPRKSCDVQVPGGVERWLGTVIPGDTSPVMHTGKPQFTFYREVIAHNDAEWELKYTGTGQNRPIQVQWGTQQTRTTTNTGYDYGLWFSLPRLAVEKTIAKVNGTAPANGTAADLALRAGDTVEYQIAATNTGNAPLTDVTIIDQLLVPLECASLEDTIANPLQDPPLVCQTWVKAKPDQPDLQLVASEGVDLTNPQHITLQIGEKLQATGTYQVTEADVRSGSVLNHAVVIAKEGFVAPAKPWQPGYVDAYSSVEAQAQRDMSICLVKVAADVPATPAAASDTPGSGAGAASAETEAAGTNLPNCTHVGLRADTPADSLLHQQRLMGAKFTLFAVDDAGKKLVATDGAPVKSYPAQLNQRGVLVVQHVPAGQYLLEEVQAPAGYQLLPQGLALRLYWDDTAAESIAKAEFSYRGVATSTEVAQVLSFGSITSPVELAISDVRVGSLPRSGRAGVFPYIAIGALLCVAGFFALRQCRAQRWW